MLNILEANVEAVVSGNGAVVVVSLSQSKLHVTKRLFVFS
jgi:hypothetical protein